MLTSLLTTVPKTTNLQIFKLKFNTQTSTGSLFRQAVKQRIFQAKLLAEPSKNKLPTNNNSILTFTPAKLPRQLSVLNPSVVLIRAVADKRIQLAKKIVNFIFRQATSRIFTTAGTTSLGTALVVNNNNKMTNEECKGVPGSVFDEADKLFDDDKFEELLELLKKQTSWETNDQLLWRLGRCEFQLSKKLKDDETKCNELVNSAYDNVKKSLEINDKNGLAHKWAAILLNEVASRKGTKERVLQCLNVRLHMEKAIEYAQTDPTSYYLLGEWHFSCYQVSWWERKIASIAFGKLPDADMEVALKMFEKAEEIEADFYSRNKLMLAKTLLQLNRDKDKALGVLQHIVTKYDKSEKWDDKEAVEEAQKLLKANK